MLKINKTGNQHSEILNKMAQYSGPGGFEGWLNENKETDQFYKDYPEHLDTGKKYPKAGVEQLNPLFMQIYDAFDKIKPELMEIDDPELKNKFSLFNKSLNDLVYYLNNRYKLGIE